MIYGVSGGRTCLSGHTSGSTGLTASGGWMMDGGWWIVDGGWGGVSVTFLTSARSVRLFLLAIFMLVVWEVVVDRSGSGRW